MNLPFKVRAIARQDHADWRALWDGYHAFYGRSGSTALEEQITLATWERFFNANEPVHALVVQDDGRVVGIAHYLFHRSTTRLHDVCCLQDLFTLQQHRGRGIGRFLIQAVYAAAHNAQCSRVYWTMHASKQCGRSRAVRESCKSPGFYCLLA